MDVTLKDGRVVEFPDGTDQKVVDAYVSRYFPEKPNVVERTIGHLSKGAGTALGMIENLGSYVQNAPNVLQGRPLSPVGEASPERYALENNPFAAQVAEHPETSMIGQLLGGAAEFIPQIPLYALGEGLALRGAAAIPKVGQYVAPLLTKGAGPLANYGKAIARAGIAGAVVGGAISSPIQTGVGEHLKEGAIGAAEFAGATAVLHPAFAGLGKVGRSIYRRMGKKATPEKVEAELERRAETDSQAAEELQRLREQKIEPAEGKAETEELYVPQGEKVPRGKEQGELFVDMPSEEVMVKLRERGYTDEKVKEILTTDPEGKELVSALEKEVPVDVKALEGETAQAEKVLESPRQRRKRLIEKAKAAKVETAEAPSVQNLSIENLPSTKRDFMESLKVAREGHREKILDAINSGKYTGDDLVALRESLDNDIQVDGMRAPEISIQVGKIPADSLDTFLSRIKDVYDAEGIEHNIGKLTTAAEKRIAIKDFVDANESDAGMIEYIFGMPDKLDVAPSGKAAEIELTPKQEAAVEKALLTAEEIDARAKAWIAEHGGRKRKVLTPGEKAVEEDATLADTIAGEGSTVFDRRLGKIEKEGFEEAIAEADRNLVESEKLLDRLADKTEKAPTDEDLVDLADDLYQTEDPVAQALVESIPKDRESLVAHVRSQMEKIIAEKKAAREAVDATKKGKERRARGKKKELTKEELEAILEAEGMGEKVGYEEEGAPRELDFSDEGYTLDMLGGQQMYNWAKKLVASRKTQQNAPSNGIIAEVNGKRLTAKDDADFVEGSMKSLATNLGKMTRAKLMTPDVAFENNPRVGPLQFDLHKRFLESIHAASKRNESIRAAETMLRDVSDKEALKNILEGREIPKSEKLRDAALIVRKELDAVREKYKEYLRGQMLENLNKHEFAVISQVLAGKDIAEAIAQYTPKDALGRRMKSPIDRAVIEDILADYKKIDNWGFDNYFTHYERGSLRIVSGGKLYAKAMSVEDAARKFIDLNQMYPELDFKLDTSHMQGELATGISSRSYGLIMNDMQKGLKETIEGINSAVQKRLAQKVLEGRFFIKPTKEFSPYALERRAKLQGEKNPFDVLYHYMYSMEKKIGLDPAIDAIRRAMAKKVVVGKEPYVAKDGTTKMRDIKQSYLTDDESKFLEKYTNDVKGMSYKTDEFVDGILKGFVAPRAYSRFVARAREIEANLKFAYRPVAGFINWLSGIGHVWTKTGLKHTTDAVAFLRTTEGKAFIKDMEPYLGINVVESATGELTTRGTFERLRLLPTPKTKVGEFGHKAIEPMAFFQAPEIPVRKLTMAANYLMSISEGMSEAAARDSAIKATWFQQFSYDIASLPEFMRGPTGRLITQFKPYLVKEIEFISHLRGPEIARYAGMQIALGGPRGLIMLAKSLPILGAFYGWSELENYLNKEFPRASRGIGGALGVDISAPATFQFPQAMRDWIGPTLSDLVNLYNNVLDPTVQNIVNFMSPDTPDVEIGKTFKSAIPIFKHYANLWDQVVGSKDGWVKDEQGRPLWNIDNMGTFTAKSLAGAESLEVNRIRVYERNLREKTERINNAKKDTTQNILESISKGEEIRQEDIDEMIRLGIKPSTLRRAAKYHALDPKMRRLLMTEIIRRPEILQEYPDAGDLER